MKSIIKIESVLLLAFFLSIPFVLFTQEEEQEKKVRIKTIQEVDGKTIERDTTFIVKEEDEVKKIIQRFTADAEGDSAASIMVDVTIDSDDEMEWRTPAKKVIIMKDGGEEEVIVLPHGHGSRIIEYKSGDGEDEKVIIVSPGGKRKVIKWKSKDGETYDFDFDYDFDLDMEELNEEMARLQDEMREMHVEILDEHGQLHDELIELKHLEELEKLKELEVIVAPPEPHMYHDFTWHHRGGMEVTDKELRDAGIKNKPDRLELDEIDVRKEEGVVDLSFSMRAEGNPKVEVYNIFGDKVYTGKPELMNGKYQIKMDLSQKQYGTYYMQIVLGNSSKTLRLKL